ncbi:uncharacterized protein LOC122380865 isoform X3 [Amphibalanus amphitrite]|nr:uncharacterized protein LOC122373708 isoform X3 [Amphibalanus amphitrite]XP_043220328.1 uncharacterized protein LOC122380865 isoform X3 [Amphibalanus amphitrite]
MPKARAPVRGRAVSQPDGAARARRQSTRRQSGASVPAGPRRRAAAPPRGRQPSEPAATQRPAVAGQAVVLDAAQLRAVVADVVRDALLTVGPTAACGSTGLAGCRDAAGPSAQQDTPPTTTRSPSPPPALPPPMAPPPPPLPPPSATPPTGSPPHLPGTSAGLGLELCEDTSAVAPALRSRIQADKFVDLALLLDSYDRSATERPPSFQLVDGTLRAAPRVTRPITSFGAWSIAFTRFAGIYAEAHPDAAVGLLAYMRQVGSLSVSGLGVAWRDFDETFRRARESDPARHPWGATAATSPLWLMAIARGVGGVARAAPVPQRQAAAGSRFRPCFAYNGQQGCSARVCRFTHACRTCRGSHPAHQCATRPARPVHRRAGPGSAAAGAAGSR